MFPTYDGNGNVTRVYSTNFVQTNQTEQVAEYRYGPFGEHRGQSGRMASKMPFRWSTKFADNETGLSYYGYRYYSASMGRWVSRDPIEEIDHINVYAFVKNSSISKVDLLGLMTTSCPSSRPGWDWDRDRDEWRRTTPPGYYGPPPVSERGDMGMCNCKTYKRETQCCEGVTTSFVPPTQWMDPGRWTRDDSSATVEDKVPIWKCSAPMRTLSRYSQFMFSGWDMCVVGPLRYLGWNPVHAVICLGGPWQDCIGPDKAAGRVGSWPAQTMATELGSCKKQMVCPSVKKRIADSLGKPHDLDFFTNNCHQWCNSFD